MLDRHRNTPEPPRLEAIYVAADASVKAVYHDNTLLVLSADGSSFTHISPAGARTVQLCEFCLSRFVPLLTELLDFRNQHVDMPAVSRPLLQQLQRSSQTFTLHFPITYTCWPATAAEAFQQGLVELPDSTRIAVLSKCGYARIMLEYTGLRFAMVWMRDATILFVQDVEEVEVWLHADDSCMYSFQSGGFVTHLLPRAAAAAWDTATSAAAAADDGPGDINSNAQHLLPHMAEHGLSSWHDVRGDLSSRVLEADTAHDMAAAAAAAPLSLQLRQLRLPGGHGHHSSAAAARSAGLDHGALSSGRPQSAAAAATALCGTDGLIDGAIDASQMSRVYAASALPEVPVAAVASGCSGGSSSSIAGCGGPALKLPVGQVAARALKFR
ncbi:hypothetical protein OEZ86_010742 [Tetradesmus obliquus]|nr:hypothetical protein OEZ86_010742 [Tetradesmus obliquus]